MKRLFLTFLCFLFVLNQLILPTKAIETATNSTTTNIQGDIDGNSKLETTDLAMLKISLAYGTQDDLAKADVNCDGLVNTADLAILKLILAGSTICNQSGHKWVEATCNTPKTCSVCQLSVGETINHDYADGLCVYCLKTKPLNPKNALKENTDYYFVSKDIYGYSLLCIYRFYNSSLTIRENPWGVYSTNEAWKENDNAITYKGETFYPIGYGGPLPDYTLTDEEIILKYSDDISNVDEWYAGECRITITSDYNLLVSHSTLGLFSKGDVLELMPCSQSIHTYNNGTCIYCNSIDPDYIQSYTSILKKNGVWKAIIPDGSSLIDTTINFLNMPYIYQPIWDAFSSLPVSEHDWIRNSNDPSIYMVYNGIEYYCGRGNGAELSSPIVDGNIITLKIDNLYYQDATLVLIRTGENTLQVKNFTDDFADCIDISHAIEFTFKDTGDGSVRTQGTVLCVELNK